MAPNTRSSAGKISTSPSTSDTDPDDELFVDAIATLNDLLRFWIDVELSNGGFFLADGSDAGNVDAEEVMPLSLIMLQRVWTPMSMTL